MQELERGDSGVRSFASVQGALAMYPIYAFGSDEQKRRWLPKMASGEVIGCFGLTEPDYGSNPADMITVAKETKDGWVLNGAKMWITNGSTAQVAVVWAKAGKVDDVNSIRGFIVPTDTKGFSAKDQKGKLSLRASDTSELVLQDVCLPKDALLPKSGGLKSPLMCLTQARYGIAWGAVGAAMACYDEAVSYAKNRVMFGHPIGGFQLQQARLADMLTEITKAQLLCLQLGRLQDQGKASPQQGSLAKRNNVNIATLDAQDLDARGVRTRADALEQLPGVTTSDELGATAQLDVSLRGFQVSPVIGLPQGVTVYVDGVRANEPDAHEVNFDLLPLEDVERVDVVYGPSVLLGRNALGAAVNLVTRRGGVPASRELEASAGSWGRYELKAHAGARHGVWDYYVGARYEHETGWRQDTRSRIGTLFAKVGLLNGTWDATLSYSGADNRIYQAGSLPESLAVARPDSNFTGGDYFTPRSHLVTFNAQRLIGTTQLAINAFGRSLESEQFNVNFVGEDSRQRNTTRAGGGAMQLSGKAPLGRRGLRWLAGADADYAHVSARIVAAPRSTPPDSLTESVRTNQVNAGAFAGANLEVVPRLTATLAARYDWIRVPFEDLIDTTQSGLSIFRRQGLELALQWIGSTGARAYANYGYTRATFETTARLATTRDSTGETVTPGDILPMVPDTRINAGLAVPLVDGRAAMSGLSLVAGLDARYVGHQWLRGDEDNATPPPSDHTLADLSLTP